MKYKIQWWDFECENWDDDENAEEFLTRFEAEDEARHLKAKLACPARWRVVDTETKASLY